MDTVVVGVAGVVALLYSARKVVEPGLVYTQRFRQPAALHKVAEEQGQAVPRRGISKPKDVKSPAVLSILQQQGTSVQPAEMYVCNPATCTCLHRHMIGARYR